MTLPRLHRSLLLVSLLASAPLVMSDAAPAQAQFSLSIGFNSFHDQLAGYGDWLYSDRWGEVWRPGAQDRDPDWRPYWAGHWVFTEEYGWTWISDEGPWGDIAYHYGRWVFDPDDGWLWIAGYVWSPAWVVWRSAGPDVGWMPMPPDEDFLRGGAGITVSFGDWNDIGGYYGYSRWYGPRFDEARFGALWTFVPGDRLSDRSFRRYALPRPQTIGIVRGSRNITNYTVVNNAIVNRSVNITVAAPGGGRPPQPVRAATVLRGNRWVSPVDQGEQIQSRARQERPRGNGLINSAPPPSPAQVQTLSNRPVPVRTGNNPANNVPGSAPGAGERHIFNRNDAGQIAARARGGNPAQPAKGAPQNAGPAAGPQPVNPQNAQPENRGPENRGPENRGPDNRGLDNRNPGNRDLQNRGPQNPPPQENRAVTPPQPVMPPPPANDNPRRNFDNRDNGRNLPRPQSVPQAPERAVTPPPAPSSQPPEQREFDRGNRPERNFDRGAEQPPPQAMPQREPAAPREQLRPTPPQVQTAPNEAARPMSERGQQDRGQQDRGQQDRGQPDRGQQDRAPQTRDRGEQDKRNDNR